MKMEEFIKRLRELKNGGIHLVEIRTFRNSVSTEDLFELNLDEPKIKGGVVCFEHSSIIEGVTFIPELMKEVKEEKTESKKARKVLQAIMDTNRFDDPEEILVTYNRKRSQVINIKNDLGDLKKAKFGLLRPSMIIFETNFKLFTQKIERIEIVYVKKNIYSDGQIF